MKDGAIKAIRIILIVVAVLLTLTLIALIASGVESYNEGRNGYSYSSTSISGLESDLSYGNYGWMLRDLKHYRDTLFSEDAYIYDDILSVAEYYQFSLIARSYFYIGNTDKASEYASRAAACANAMDASKYASYREDIDYTLSRIGN